MRLVTKPRMVPLSAFTPELILAVPELQDEIAESYIRQAAIDFALQTNALRRVVAIEAQAGVGDYMLDAGQHVVVNRIVRVCDWRGNSYYVSPGKACRPPCWVSVAEICPSSCGGGAFGHNPVLTVEFVDPNELHVRPVPEVDFDLGYEVEVSVIPTREACELDEAMFAKHAPVIVSGALKYLHLMPNRRWSNPGLAQAADQAFKLGCARALGDALVGVSGGSHRLTTRRVL